MDPTISFVMMLLPFGVLLGFGAWQLVSVNMAKKRRLERERARPGV